MRELLPPSGHGYSEAEVLELLRGRIAALLDTERAWLLGKLYRLDVRERDIKLALRQAEVAGALAGLVMARQRERVAARARWGGGQGEVEEGWEW